MKKLSVLLISLLVAMLAACTPEQLALYNDLANHEIQFGYVMLDEFMLGDVAELVDFADHVFTGKVESISFAVINDVTGKAPAEECNPRYLRLITIYDVAVINAYNGADRSTMRFLVQGGIKGYREHEQLFVTMEAGVALFAGSYRIMTLHELSALEAGETYLFVALDLEVELDGYSNFIGIVNTKQSVYDLYNPFELVDTWSDISVESIISEFGPTAFAEHWAWWQSETPDWEQRLEQGNPRSRQ